MREVIVAHSETFKRNNLTPQDGITRLLNVENDLATNPGQTIKAIAEAYGVDLRQLVSGLTGDQPSAGDGTQQGTPDPVVSTLQSQLVATGKEVNQLKSYLTAQQRTQHESEQSALQRHIADFAKDPKYPHFEAVRKTMAKLMEGDETLSMADAYEEATYAKKDIRTRILSDQRKADDEKVAKEKADRLAAAKKAGGVNVKSTTSTGTTPKTIDDTLKEVAARHYPGH